VADVLGMAALQVGNPIAEIILVKSYNLAVRRGLKSHFSGGLAR
jgi:hypothetical protein